MFCYSALLCPEMMTQKRKEKNPELMHQAYYFRIVVPVEAITVHIITKVVINN